MVRVNAQLSLEDIREFYRAVGGNAQDTFAGAGDDQQV